MRWVHLTGVFTVLFVCVASAEGAPKSYTFGGFSPGGREYLKRGPDDLVCAPEPDTACRAVDKKTTRGFAKPARSRKAAGQPLSVEIGDGTFEVFAGGRKVGGVAFLREIRVTSVNQNFFVSPDETVVAVEYEVSGKDGKWSDVAAFDLQAAPGPPVEKTTATRSAPVAGGGNAFTRALARGGVWEQRLVPCDQAGVTLKLTKTRKFGIKILTRCQGRKDVTDLDGTWSSEGDDTVVLSFENEEGPVETMVCRFAECADAPEDCLTCTQDDVTFTMQVVRR
jgi:hypothetical protein